jgi:hypothetical protein
MDDAYLNLRICGSMRGHGLRCRRVNAVTGSNGIDLEVSAQHGSRPHAETTVLRL